MSDNILISRKQLIVNTECVLTVKLNDTYDWFLQLAIKLHHIIIMYISSVQYRSFYGCLLHYVHNTSV